MEMPSEQLGEAMRLGAALAETPLIGADTDLDTVIQQIADRARALVGAQRAAIGVLDTAGGEIVKFVTAGLSERDVTVIGVYPKSSDVRAIVQHSHTPLRVSDRTTNQDLDFQSDQVAVRSFLGVPIQVHGVAFGNLYLTEKIGGGDFTDNDVDSIEALATAAGAAIETCQVRTELEQPRSVQERERIARDLHDVVIQRLYGVGIALQASLRLTTDESLHARLLRAIDDLDDTIAQVRATIEELGDLPL